MLKDYSYKNKNGKTVKGTAAALHLIYSEFNGIDAFAEALSESAINGFVKNNIAKIVKNAKKKHLA